MLEVLLALLRYELLYEDPLIEAAAIIAANADIAARGARRVRHQPTRERYVEDVIPRFSNKEFKSHFKMERDSFEELLQVLEPHLTTRTVALEKKVLATLWILGKKESFRSVADRFALSKASLHKTFIEVCDAINNVQPNFIDWPNRQEQTQIANEFLQRTGFPGVVGCIDVSYIPIPDPSEHRAAYMCRKGVPCLKLQAICDNNLRFTDVYSGWPGSVSDARVFRNSPIRQLLETGNVSKVHHLLGDSAYALDTYIMVPFRDDGNLTEEEIAFNIKHTQTRIVIERAFALLKATFRRLRYLDMKPLEKIPSVMMAACVLHNFILTKERLDDDVPQHGNLGDDNSLPGYIPAVIHNNAINKRQGLANLLA